MPKNTMVRFSLLAIVFIFFTVPVQANDLKDKENKAIQAAESFLSFVDSGQYEKSWEESSTFFKSQISQAQWAAKLSSLRPLLGKVIKRSVKNTEYLTSAPGAPDGEYVIVAFQTTFENKKSTTEKVTPMLDKDGKWRVTGYFIE